MRKDIILKKKKNKATPKQQLPPLQKNKQKNPEQPSPKQEIRFMHETWGIWGGCSITSLPPNPQLVSFKSLMILYLCVKTSTKN